MYSTRSFNLAKRQHLSPTRVDTVDGMERPEIHSSADSRRGAFADASMVSKGFLADLSRHVGLQLSCCASSCARRFALWRSQLVNERCICGVRSLQRPRDLLYLSLRRGVCGSCLKCSLRRKAVPHAANGLAQPAEFKV